MPVDTITAPENPVESNEPKIKGTMIEVGEVADWGNDLRIIEKGSKGENGQQVTDPTTEEETVIVAPTAPPAPVAETPVVTVEDPGEFEPKDYSFDVTVYDEEGKNGKTIKVSSIDEWENLLEKDSNLGTAASLLKANRLAAKMEANTERDIDAYTQKKEAYEASLEAEQTRVDTSNQWSNEIAYLASKGELPPVDSKYVDANWADPEVAKQPGVKERIELLSYMRDENAIRIAAGLAPMRSVLDAFNAFQLDQAKKNTTTRATQAAEARKAAGARVAGTSPNPVTVVPKGIAVGNPNAFNELGGF